MITTKEKAERIEHIEMQITEIALRGTALVPDQGDMTKLVALGRELFDITKGRNELLFDKKGRPNIVVNFPCDKTARLDWLADNNKYFTVPSSMPAPTDGSKQGLYRIHPAFLLQSLNRQSNTRESVMAMAGFSLGKYPDCKVKGVNYHVSLRGLPPAHSGGGFTVSYSGIASECDAINAGTVMPDAPYVGNISLAIMAYIALRSLREGFQCRGNTNRGQSDKKSEEKGDPCGPFDNGRPVHAKGGSGSLRWFHDGTPEGVWGLVGNCWEILHGYFLKDGELQFVPYNNAIDSTATLLAQGSADFYAMNTDGNFISLENEASLKYDYVDDYSTTPQGENDVGHPFELVTTITHTNMSNQKMYGYVENLNSIGVRESDIPSLPTALKILLLGPLDDGNPQGYTSARWFTGCTRVRIGGGNYYSGSCAGLFAGGGAGWGAGDSHWDGSARVAFARRIWDLGRIGV